MFRWVRRLVKWGLVLIVVGIGGIAAAYYSGATLPVYHDLMPVTFKNWNQTANVAAEVEHDSSLTRRDGRVHLTVDLQLPEAARRLQAFLDGGRTEVVACGPQKLYMHSLTNGSVDIDGEIIRVAGMVDLELSGLLDLRDDWPVSTAVQIGHDRTTIWADVLSLDVANIPEPMIAVLLENYSRFAYTREQIWDMVAKSLEAEDAAFVAAHREALDLAFERAVPARRGDVLVVDATISMDEGAVFNALGDRFVDAAGDRATQLAEILGPAKAHAQFNLDDLGKKLEKGLQGAGQELIDQATQGGASVEQLLQDPEELIAATLGNLSDCKVSF